MNVQITFIVSRHLPIWLPWVSHNAVCERFSLPLIKIMKKSYYILRGMPCVVKCCTFINTAPQRCRVLLLIAGNKQIDCTLFKKTQVFALSWTSNEWHLYFQTVLAVLFTTLLILLRKWSEEFEKGYVLCFLKWITEAGQQHGPSVALFWLCKRLVKKWAFRIIL